MALILLLTALGSLAVALAVVGLMFRDAREVAVRRHAERVNSGPGSVDSGV